MREENPTQTPYVPSPATADSTLQPILSAEMQKLGAEFAPREKTMLNLLHSVCYRECRQVARSEGDVTAGCASRDNLEGS